MCENGKEDIVQLLLNNGADVNLSSEEGFLLSMQRMKMDMRELYNNYLAMAPR